MTAQLDDNWTVGAFHRLHEEIETLRRERDERSGWQDISTAPKDGCVIYGGHWQTSEQALVYFNSDGKWEVVDGLTNLPEYGKFFNPSHWQPKLSQPPWPSP